MRYPWEKQDNCACGGGDISGHDTTCPFYNVEPEPVPEKSMLSEFERYVQFMDTYVRVKVYKNGAKLGTFSVVSGDTELNSEISLQNGSMYRIVVVGHPVTDDPMMTPEELANYLLTQ